MRIRHAQVARSLRHYVIWIYYLRSCVRWIFLYIQNLATFPHYLSKRELAHNDPLKSDLSQIKPSLNFLSLFWSKLTEKNKKLKPDQQFLWLLSLCAPHTAHGNKIWMHKLMCIFVFFEFIHTRFLLYKHTNIFFLSVETRLDLI